MIAPTKSPAFDRLLVKFCKVVLLLLPFLMVYAHVRAIGWTWNYATHAKFSPVSNYVSDYAYRSPAAWAIVACIYGFAFVLGFISWNAANRPRTAISWIVAVSSAIAMFKLTEVAIYPVKSPEVTETLMQEALDKNGLDRTKDEIWRLWLTLRGREIPQGVTINDFLATHQSDRLHRGGIKPAWLLMVVTMIGAFRLWGSSGMSRSRWIGGHAMVALLFAVAVVGSKLRPEWVGLFQRISFVGVYAWMWLVVRAIANERTSIAQREMPAS